VSPETFVDVVYVTDPRLSGGGNKSIVEEIDAHAAAGYTTGVLPLLSGTRGARPIDRSIAGAIDRGRATLLRPERPVRCRLLLVRGPAIFLAEQVVRPDVRADRAVLVANAVHRHRDVSRMAYDPLEAHAAATAMLGQPLEWVPLSPIVRTWLRRLAPDLALGPLDWGNVIDVDRWHVDRPVPVRRPLRIGRHSRDGATKWPADAAQLRAAYPTDDPDVSVHVLGGADAAGEVLGGVPPRWEVQPFDGTDVHRFLADIDFHVYFHHPDWVEAFGRAVLEAAASGAVPVVADYLREVFGDAALYAEPATAMDRVRALADDPDELTAQRERGRTVIAERYGHEAHVGRLRELIGPPREASPSPVGVAPPRPPRARPRPILFVTDNGHGLGHLTRLLAVARRLPPPFVPLFVTMSEAYGLVRDHGFAVEHVPSIGRLGVGRTAWHGYLLERLGRSIARSGAEALVIDHVNPPRTLHELRGRFPQLQLVWVRRGMWRPGTSIRERALPAAAMFDQVVEPGDVAATLDRGATTEVFGVQRVAPVTLPDPDELLSRDEARRALGLDLDGTAVLLQLSADRTDELTAAIERTRDDVHALDPTATVVVPVHPLHDRGGVALDGVQPSSVRPMALHLRAFDLAVSTAGYNSVHELLLAAVPTLLVARESETVDDQARRASVLPLLGAGEHVTSFDDRSALQAALARLLDPQQARRCTAAAQELGPFDGGAAIASLVVDGVPGGRA
jgi:hypothetical protein